jgi:hypothetical protein
MQKSRISNGELNFLVLEKLRNVFECRAASVAIIPDGQTWRAILTHSNRAANASCRLRSETIQNA